MTKTGVEASAVPVKDATRGLEVSAGLAADAGRAELAAQLWGASDGLMDAVGGALAPTIGWMRDRYVIAVCETLGKHGFARASAAGAALSSAQTVGLARQHASPNSLRPI